MRLGKMRWDECLVVRLGEVRLGEVWWILYIEC